MCIDTIECVETFMCIDTIERVETFMYIDTLMSSRKGKLMYDILGQGVNEQEVVSVVDPEHAAPAPAGAGLEQLLVLSFDPVPQVP